MIELCVQAFPWATYRQTKGAIKLNLLLDHDGYLFVFIDLTHGNVHEVNNARCMDSTRNSMVHFTIVAPRVGHSRIDDCFCCGLSRIEPVGHFFFRQIQNGIFIRLKIQGGVPVSDNEIEYFFRSRNRFAEIAVVHLNPVLSYGE